MKYATLNLETEKPTVDEAIALIEREIEICKKIGIVVLKVIHGYGSSGSGGAIKKALKTWSIMAKRRKLFRDFVKGEEWNFNNEKSDEIKKLCPDVLGDLELYYSNPGISLIVI